MSSCDQSTVAMFFYHIIISSKHELSMLLVTLWTSTSLKPKDSIYAL